MSRSNYSDECDDNLAAGRWRGAVHSAINGKRGQKLLTEILAAFDAMPVKELGADALVTAEGQYCTLGVLGAVRGIDMTVIDPENYNAVAKAFDVAPALVREIVWLNDDWIIAERFIDGKWTYNPELPTDRFNRMREWVLSQCKEVGEK